MVVRNINYNKRNIVDKNLSSDCVILYCEVCSNIIVKGDLSSKNLLKSLAEEGNCPVCRSPKVKYRSLKGMNLTTNSSEADGMLGGGIKKGETSLLISNDKSSYRLGVHLGVTSQLSESMGGIGGEVAYVGYESLADKDFESIVFDICESSRGLNLDEDKVKERFNIYYSKNKPKSFNDVLSDVLNKSISLLIVDSIKRLSNFWKSEGFSSIISKLKNVARKEDMITIATSTFNSRMDIKNYITEEEAIPGSYISKSDLLLGTKKEGNDIKIFLKNGDGVTESFLVAKELSELTSKAKDLVRKVVSI